MDANVDAGEDGGYMTNSSANSDSDNNSCSSEDESQLGTITTAALGLLEDHSSACQAVGNLWELLYSEDREFVLGNFSVNPLIPKIDKLVRLLSGHDSIFKNFTGFKFTEFEQLCQHVCPVISAYSRHKGKLKLPQGRKSKLSPEEQLLSFILYTKHNTGATPQTIEWNCSRTSLNVDGRFVASCINVGLEDEIQWPDAARREALGRVLPDFPGCIGHINGTLCKIRQPRIKLHKQCYNNRKAMYCMNNVIIVDHDGLIIYVDAGFPGSAHDVRCLRNSDIYKNWQQYFSRADLDHVKEYLLGDPSYLGAEEFILRRIDRREVLELEMAGEMAYNKRHAQRHIAVE